MTLTVGGGGSILVVCVVFASRVVSTGIGLREGFLVFGGDVAVTGRVDFVLVETFLEYVVDRSSRVVGAGVLSRVVSGTVGGGFLSAGGSRLDCLGVRDGGKK